MGLKREFRALFLSDRASIKTRTEVLEIANLDKFEWIAVVAPAPNTRPAAELLTDVAALNRLKLFWLSVGNRDALYRVAHGVHTLATEKGVTHIWRVDTNAHDTGAMSSNFYHFAQKLFR